MYIAAGVYYNYSTKQQLSHPHVQQWRQLGGLVKDGIMFSKARYLGETYQGAAPPADIASYGATSVAHPEEAAAMLPGTDGTAYEDSPASTPRKGDRKKKKKKKRKKKTAVIEDAGGAGLE